MKMKFLIFAILIIALLLAACSTAVSSTDSKNSAGNTSKEKPSKTADIPTIKSVYKTPKDPKKFTISDRDYLIVVNANHKYDFDGEYHKNLQADLVFFPNVVDGDVMAAEKATYLAFTLLQYDLWVNYGIQIGLYDGYRTAEDQEYLAKLYEDGNTNITKLQEVSYSEHHTGLLLDVVMWHEGEWVSPTEERCETIPKVAIFYERMVDYGFIERYPSDKVDITGCEDKEYEIRFVGSAEIAHAITDAELCLEEYISN